MSKFQDGSYGSLTGIALIGKVLAGRCGMKYTRAAVGSGAIPADMTPKTMTDVAGYIMDAKIAAVTNPIDGECQVTIQIKSDDVEYGFYATGIVLFAEDPDEGEVPYTYLLLENEPEWIRPASSIVGKLATFDIIAAVGDIDAVTAVIDPEAIATVGQVEQMIAVHNGDPNAHDGDDTAAQVFITPIVIPSEGWVLDDSEQDYPYSIDIVVEQATESCFPSVALDRLSLKSAEEAGLCPTVSASDCSMRFWSEKIPDSDLTGTLMLTAAGANFGGSGGTYVLPAATDTTLGGVRVQNGSGLKVDTKGNLSLDTATDEEILSMFDSGA